MKYYGLFILLTFSTGAHTVTLHLSEGASQWAKRNKIFGAAPKNLNNENEKNQVIGKIFGSDYLYELSMSQAVSHVAENLEVVSVLRTTNTWKGAVGDIEQFYFAADGKIIQTEAKLPSWLDLKNTALMGKTENGTPVTEFKYFKNGDKNTGKVEITEVHATELPFGESLFLQKSFSLKSAKHEFQIVPATNSINGLKIDFTGAMKNGEKRTATRYFSPHLNPGERTVGFFTDADTKLMTVVTSQNRMLQYKVTTPDLNVERPTLLFELDKITLSKAPISKAKVTTIKRQTRYTHNLDIEGQR